LRHKLLLSLSLTTCLTSPVAAESWYFVGTAAEEINYADADSLQVNGNIDKLKVFSSSLNGLGPEGNIFYTTVNIEIDCSNRKLRWLDIQAFDEKRQYLTAPPVEMGWQEIATDNAAEGFRAFACDGAGRDQKVDNPFDDADGYFYYYYDEDGTPLESTPN